MVCYYKREGGWRVWWVIMREGYNRIGVGYDKRWGCSGL